MKRIISSILVLTLFLSLTFSVSASTDEHIVSGKSLDCDWNLNTDTGELTVSGNGRMWDCVIDNEGNDQPDWYEYNNLIKTVTILEGVTSIGDLSFKNCKNLKKVVIPNSVKVIGIGAFSNCFELSKVVFDTKNSNLEYICFSAFSGCSKLKKTSFPEKLVSVGDYAFHGCGFTDIVLPDSLKTIGDSAFALCNLTEVYIPKNITLIGASSFIGKKVKRFTVDKNNKYYSDFDGNLYNKAHTKLLQYAYGKQEKTFNFPKSIKIIGEYAFSEDKNLRKINIPVSVKRIDYNAFYMCKAQLNYLGTAKRFAKIKQYERMVNLSLEFKRAGKNNTLRINETDGLKLSSNLYTKDNPTSFKSSNSKIVRVSKNGRVRALKKGTAKITVIRNGAKSALKVTVK